MRIFNRCIWHNYIKEVRVCKGNEFTTWSPCYEERLICRDCRAIK